MVNFTKGITAALLFSLCPSAFPVIVGFSAVIGVDVSGCSISVPESTLSFNPVFGKSLTGGTTTHQIKPLQVALFCSDVNEAITPSLSLTGTTPYAGTDNTVFLDGDMNGVGFMVRRSDGNQPPLSGFYNTGEAIANNGNPVTLTTLNSSNDHYSEENFWVGLVGPLGSDVVPGPFSATLVMNVVFE